LSIRVQLVFGRGGQVKSLALVADRREDMPCRVEIHGTQGQTELVEWPDGCYEPVEIPGDSDALSQGVEWRGRGNARHLRWVMGGRDIYVLAPGDEFGLHGFVSTARLRLNARHVVLAKATVRDQVLAALEDAGCSTPEVSDDQTPGVPPGWILIREVIPTRAVPMRNEADILNALCPSHDIEPHYIGGVRLERNVWLSGFPPRIRLTGELGEGFQVLIDGLKAQPSLDGALEVEGWDSEGEHRLSFGDRVETYSLLAMEENWHCWQAHTFRTGTAICGACVHGVDERSRCQVRVPFTNPLLIGARPGDVFCCQAAYSIRCSTILAFVPFPPVWALPGDPIHSDKRAIRLVLLNAQKPIPCAVHKGRTKDADRDLWRWASVINDAGRKHLEPATDTEEVESLWRSYRSLAKQLWRKMR
jgi:hypothetical protein